MSCEQGFVVFLAGAMFACSAGRSGSDEGAVADAGSIVQDFFPTEAMFDCVKDPEWTQVGAAVFKNVLGRTNEMLAVARSPDGGVYPVGTVVQLLPTEASVKRAPGFSNDSHDWEFFVLSVGDGGTAIVARGGDAGVVNPTNGGSCLACHGQAAPQWDLVCEDAKGNATHGCGSLPFTGTELAAFRASDPRCR